MRLRAVLAVGLLALLLDRKRRGEKFGFAGVDGAGLPPDAGEIGLAFQRVRRGT